MSFFLLIWKRFKKNKICVSEDNYLLCSWQIFTPSLWLDFLLIFFSHCLSMGSYFNVSIVEIINLLIYTSCFLCLRTFFAVRTNYSAECYPKHGNMWFLHLGLTSICDAFECMVWGSNLILHCGYGWLVFTALFID